jgi:hypothetical protein
MAAGEYTSESHNLKSEADFCRPRLSERLERCRSRSPEDLDEAFDRALDRLRRTAGLDRVVR